MSELKRGEINDERDNHLHSTRIQHAIQKLERSDRVQSSDFTASCSELLQLNFHSEEGRFYVIDKLTQFHGNFVAKIIRKGLSSLSKVYTEPKAFEDESTALVDLCFSLYSKQQDRKEDGQCLPSPKQEEDRPCFPIPKQLYDGQCSPSPALLVDCAADLCEELLKSAKYDGTSSLHVEIQLSKCLEELVTLYQIIFGYMLTPGSDIADYAPWKLPNFFQETFSSLKQRASDERFDELINKTAIVAKGDQIHLKLLNGTHIRNDNFLLKYWNKLLKSPFVSNSFAIEIVQHDIVVNGDHGSTSDYYRHEKSLVYRMSSLKDTDICRELCNVDKERQDILFNHDFLFSHYTPLCLKLIQSDIPKTCLQMLFGIFISTENSSPNVEEDMKIYNSIASSLSPSFRFIHVYNHIVPERRRLQSLMFELVAQATLRQKGNCAAIEEIIKFWKATFPRNGSSYEILAKILIFTILEPQMLSEMPEIPIPMGFQRKPTMKPHHCEAVLNDLVGFLSQLPVDILCSTTDWLSLYFCLVKSFPESWNCKDSLKFIEFFSNLDVHGFGEVKEIVIDTIKGCFESIKADLQIQTTVLGIMIERLLEDSDLERYKLTLTILPCIAPYMEADKMRKYLSDFLTIVRNIGLPPLGGTLEIQSGNMVQLSNFSWSKVFRLITVSTYIGQADKEEMFMSHLRVIKNANDIRDMVYIMKLSTEFLLLSVNASSVKQFYHRFENPSNWEVCGLIVKCCTAWCRYEDVRDMIGIRRVYPKRDFDDLVTVLFSAFDGCLHNSRRCFDLFSQVIVRYLSMASSCSAENCTMLVACVAGSISVGTFDQFEHDSAISLTCTALALHKDDCESNTSMDILALYSELIKTFREMKYGYDIDDLYRGLEIMFRIPLMLKEITILIRSVCKLLQRGNLRRNHEVMNIMSHLFKIPENKKTTQQSSATTDFISLLTQRIWPELPEEETAETSAPFSNVSSNSLKEHFVNVMTMSVTQIQYLSRMPICTSTSKELTLLKVLLKKSPLAFNQSKSSKLFKILLEHIIANEKNARFFMDLVDATIEEDVSPEEFQRSLQKIEDMIRNMTPPLMPLITSCVTEYYKIGEDKERRIMTLLLILKDWKWTKEDLKTITSKRIAFINIPKQMVQAFQTTSCPAEMREKIKRLIEMAHQLAGLEHTKMDATLAEREFQMFLNDTDLNINHLSTALFACEQACQSEHYVDFFKEKLHSSEGIQEINQYSPGVLVCFVINQLQRLEVTERDLKNATMKMIEALFKNTQIPRYFAKCNCVQLMISSISSGDTAGIRTIIENYISLFRDILRHSDFIEEVQHLLTLHSIHAVLCKGLIVAACTWKNRKKSREEALSMNENIHKTLNDMTSDNRCYKHLEAEIDVMARIIRTTEDLSLVTALFLKLTDYRKRNIPLDCLKAINGWSNSREIFEFLSKLEELTNPYIGIYRFHHAIPVLPFICMAFPADSANKVIEQFQRIVAKREEHDNDPLGLQRIAEWSKTMTGVSRSVIESWCTSLVLYENLTSRDVDSIANLTPNTIQLISKEPGEIEKCLFETTAPKSWQDKHGLKSFKRSLQFAKIVNEFASVAKIFEKNVLLLEKIKNGTHDLCCTFLENQTSSGGMYKVRFNFFKEMFVLVFTKEVGINEDSMSNLTSQKRLSSGFVTVFRRLARLVQFTPVLFGYLKSIVNCTLQYIDHSSKPEYQAIQNVIHKHVMALEANQDAMHTLQAAGYNQGGTSNDQCTSSEDQGTSSEDQGISSEDQGISSEDQCTSSEDQGTSSEDQCSSSDDQGTRRKDQVNSSEDQGNPDEDLWSYTSIQLSSYVPSVDSLLKFRIQRLLRQTWREWRHILSELKIEEIDVNGEWIKTNELMNYSDSLDTMESQLEAVKKATGSAPPHCWSSDRRRQLMEKEKYDRASFEKESKQETKKSTLTKMVISWDNQLLDAVKTCSEKIPGCYAPDGFLSGKPVICGLAVDNRILTLYKQEKGKTLTELENVEVKLFPVGMLVFGNHSSGHCYDTDQLWAAFFKMLLLKRLVPKIFLTNISPGFEWIKRFVSPEDPTSPPERMVTFRSCNTLIPTNEDGFDYEPNTTLRGFYSRTPSEPSDAMMAELIILTPENVQMMDFPSLKSPKRDELIRALMKKIPQAVQNNQQLLEMHPRPDIREKLVKRLTCAIRQAVEISVDKQVPQPVETVLEKVSKCIDLKKLSSGLEEKVATKVKENGEDFYGQIILDALRTEMDGHAEYNKEYDCCEHVQFLQSNEFTPDRDE